MQYNDGWHGGRAFDFGIDCTDNGTEFIAVSLIIDSSDQPGDEGKTIQARLFCTDNAIGNTIEQLRAMGWTGDDLSVFADSNANDPATLLPNAIRFAINNEEYEGKWYPKVGKIVRAQSGKVFIKNRIEGAAAKAFGQRFKAACQAMPAGSPPKPKSAQSAPKQPPAQRQPQTRQAQADENLNNGNDPFPF